MNWLRWPLEHYSISLLIIGILFVMGIYGMYVMPKDEFPHSTIRQGVVVAVYPGATSEEVEEQVARPLERYLFTYGEVNRIKTTTTSQNSSMGSACKTCFRTGMPSSGARSFPPFCGPNLFPSPEAMTMQAILALLSLIILP